MLAKREQIRALVEVAQRVGYGLFGLAVVGFFAGFVIGFEPWIVTVVIAALVIGSVVLAPAIVFGYGVKAADREDRGGGSFH